ncbi:CDP-glucose 4,6-dehydratase [Rhodohalobacter sp. SW132]|uniref:CDP-glucose 4,6-dehydratase n=1 Tax=Rhodohalobacter sp. SW132 TaxID=2293433 RepID=UPI000E224A9E|nr:CDP-glucose 4,6-dehydratase [Rhodohalobacter sp. SW132]REL24181.1 CDP-glucose 4,6-dehydratase [Rhodohalobacter sp. SW132]
MEINRSFWNGKKVFITGHTGFKGSWLSFWLTELGAKVKGYALPPAETPNLFESLKLEQRIQSVFGDIRDFDRMKNEMLDFEPEIIFHMAAQALVRESYENPLETFESNVMGTANLLEAVRSVPGVRSLISVTSDKCYENKEWDWKYREIDPVGGRDPYSASKGCAELITSSFRRSFFNDDSDGGLKTGIATVRAGNVIGGGDWSRDRLIPDIMRSFSERKAVIIRNPSAVRPWQYILDLLNGYMILAEKLYDDPGTFSEAWNFGPSERDEQSVEFITDKMIKVWGDGASWKLDKTANPHEAKYLKLDSSKSRMRLRWSTQVNLPQALEYLTLWYKKYFEGADMVEFTRQQIKKFEEELKLTQ